MAISSTHAQLLRRLQPILPHGGTLLEIGEANWYGDVEPGHAIFAPPDDFEATLQLVEANAPGVVDLQYDDSGFIESAAIKQSADLFAIAKAFYASLFAPSRIVSIDMHGTPAALRFDLNKPLPPLGLFDVIINHGTAEHVFNIAQVFASMHAACKIGGLMIHESPFTGWIDHGFYCLQPTLFYDLAAANGYEIVSVSIEQIEQGLILAVESRDHVIELAKRGELPDNSMLFVVFRKRAATPFAIPVQGYYAQTLSEAARKAWGELR